MSRPEVTGRKINAKAEREVDARIPEPLSDDAEEDEPEQVEADEDAASGPERLRPELTSRKIGVKSAKPDANRIRGPPAADNADAYSVAEFCRRHGISPQFFYKFKNLMPATIRIGARVLISREAAAKWRRDREAATEFANTS
jgi:hypothetical protein